MNDRVERITSAHFRARGTKPSPGLIFDILRGEDKLGGMSYDDLFKVPGSKREARIMSGARQTQLPEPPKRLSDLDLIKGAGKAVLGSHAEYEQYIDDHPELKGAIKRNPRLTQKYIIGASDLRTDAWRQKQLASIVPVQADLFGKLLESFFVDVPYALVAGPAALAVYGGLATKKSVEQRSADPLGTFGKETGKAVYQGVKEEVKAVEKGIMTGDWNDAAELSGFIALDLLGVTALTAGTAARAGRAGSAAAKGRRVRTFVQRPRGGLIPIGPQRAELEARARALGVEKELDGYLYHGTTEKGLAEIEKTGRLAPGSKVTTSKKAALAQTKPKPEPLKIERVDIQEVIEPGLFGEHRIPYLYRREDGEILGPVDTEVWDITHQELAIAYKESTGQSYFDSPTTSEIPPVGKRFASVEVFTGKVADDFDDLDAPRRLDAFGDELMEPTGRRGVYYPWSWEEVPIDLIVKMKKLHPGLPQFAGHMDSKMPLKVQAAAKKAMAAEKKGQGPGQEPVVVLIKKEDATDLGFESSALPKGTQLAGNAQVAGTLRPKPGETLEAAYLRQRIDDLPEGHTEYHLGSNNMAWYGVQRLLWRNRRLGYAERLINETSPFSAATSAAKFLESDLDRMHLGYEQSMTRHAATRVQFEREMMEIPRRDLDFVAKQSGRVGAVMRHIGAGRWRRFGLTKAEEKVIHVLSSDIEGTHLDKLAAWKNLHEGLIERGMGHRDAHEGHLVLLAEAEKILSKPASMSKALRDAIDLAREASAYQELLKIQHLGFTPFSADLRIAMEGVVVSKGKKITDVSKAEGRPLLALEGDFTAKMVKDANSSLELAYKRVAYAQKRVAESKPTTRAHSKWAAELKKREEILADAKDRVKHVKEYGPEAAFAVRQAFDAFYVPTVVEGLRAPQMPVGTVRVTERAAPFDPKRIFPEFGFHFSGDAIIQGDFRIDTTNLISDAVGRSVRAVTIKHEYERLLKLSTTRPRSLEDIPIPKDLNQTITPELRSILESMDNTGRLTAREAEQLANLDLDDLISKVSPAVPRDKKGKMLRQGGELEGYRWVSPSHVFETYTPSLPPPGLGRKAAMAGQYFSELFRLSTLYMRAAYGLNLLSNTAMLWVEQNPYVATKSMSKSLLSHKLYGDDVVKRLDVMAGEGKWRSFIARDIEDMPAFFKLSRGTAEAWHHVTDGWMRRAAVIYEVERFGKGKAFFEEFMTDDKWAKQRLEASLRAKKSMVEFDNMRPLEKAWLRHWVFIYPWRSRSFVWSLRVLKEHPAQAAILAALGDESQEDILEEVGGWWENRVPDWFKRIGYIPVGTDDLGNPQVINPSQAIAPFNSLNETLGYGRAFWGAKTESSLMGTFGPTIQWGAGVITGRDEFGNEFDRGRLLGPTMMVVESIPQFSAWTRRQKAAEQKPLEPVDFFGTSAKGKEGLIARRNKAIEQMALSPGWFSGFGILFSGGLTKRSASRMGLMARWWRDADDDEKHEVKKALVQTYLKAQAKLLKQPLPPKVANFVNFSMEFEREQVLWEREHGFSPGERVRDDIMIGMLKDRGLVSPKDVERMTKEIQGLPELSDPKLTSETHQAWRNRALTRFADRGALVEWDRDVRVLGSFRKDVLQYRLRKLSQWGVARANVENVPQEQLFRVGRQYIKWAKQVEAMEDEARLRSKQSDSDGALAKAEVAAFKSKADKPVGNLPSFVRLDHSFLNEEQRIRKLRALAKADWSDLSTFEKELLGKKSTTAVSDGWVEYHRVISTYRQQNPGETLQREQILGVVKQLNRVYPGFTLDYQTSNAPLYRRLRELTPYQRSENKADWDWVFENARAMEQGIANGVPKTQANAAWKDYVRKVQPWIQANRPDFWKELLTFGTVADQDGPDILFDLLT